MGNAQNLIFCSYFCRLLETEEHNPQINAVPLSRLVSAKHEIIRCERCGTGFECKANAGSKCQCNTVSLTLNEMQHISELYDGCLCAKCLFELQQAYRDTLK